VKRLTQKVSCGAGLKPPVHSGRLGHGKMASGPEKEFCVLALMKICSYVAATVSIKGRAEFPR